ncbi:MAG: hypothetical protein QM831_30800 [Kofleriaceae bacterium]
MKRAILICAVACGHHDDKAKPAPAPAPVKKDVPVIPGSTVLYDDGLTPMTPRLVGDTLVFADQSCCLKSEPVAGGEPTTLVKRTQITDYAIADKQLVYVGLAENAEQLSVRGVTLAGADGMKPQSLPKEIEVAHVVVAGNDVYVAGMTNAGAMLVHSTLDGATPAVTPVNAVSPSLVSDGTRAFIIFGQELHALTGGTVGPSLGKLPDAQNFTYAIDGDWLYYATDHAIQRAALTPFKIDAWSIPIDEAALPVAAGHGRVAWAEGHKLYVSSGTSKSLLTTTTANEYTGLAIGKDAVYYATAFLYGENAKTIDERRATQRPGVVASTPLK